MEKRKKTHEVVRKMKEANLPIEQIAKIVELKVEEVKAILNEKKIGSFHYSERYKIHS